MLLQQLINGITQGSIFALLAVCCALIWGLLKMVNFAIGEIYMFGGFMGWLIVTYWTQNIFIAMLAGFAIGWVLGYVIEKAAFKTLRGAPHIAPVICTLGFSVLLKELANVFFGAETKSMPDFFSASAFTIGQANITWLQIIMIVTALAIVVGLHLLIYKTKIGLGIRAVSLDHQAAGLMGINVDRVISIAFSISGALTGLIGVLGTTYYNAVNPFIGFTPGLKGFVAAVFGGITSMPGALLGGYLLGIIENLSVQFVSSGYRDFIAYSILILFLLFRPNGILGKKSKL